MRCAKTVGLVALAVAGLMALAGGASATPLTSPAGTQVGTGTKVHAEVENSLKIDGAVPVTCKSSTIEGEVTSSSATTAGITLAKLTTEECGVHTVTVLKPGSLELHATGEGKATMTSSGMELTVLTHGIFSTTHCLYKTEGTDAGTFTGSSSTSATATWDIGSVSLIQPSTDFGCGMSAELTGSYKFTSPDYLDVD
jgi:hypothetical protein